MLQHFRVARYWGKKVYDVLDIVFSKILDDATGKVILDPFGGAGCIIVEALKRGARGIYIDINPYAYLLSRVSVEWFDPDALLERVQKVFSRKRIVYRGLDGSKKFMDRDALYTVEVNGVRKRVKYYEWVYDECWAVTTDNERVKSSDFADGTPYYPFPQYELRYPWGEPFDKRRTYNNIAEFFTNRNLIIITNIWHDIGPLRVPIRGVSSREHRALVLLFLSILYRASKMSRSGAGSWGINSYWVPSRHVEYNPYDLLQRKIEVLMRVKPSLQGVRITGNVRRVRDVISGVLDAAFLLGDAKAVLRHIPAESVDYVVTDPPHSDEVQYLELSFFMNAWIDSDPYLRMLDEIVVNRKQGKDFETYIRMLTETYSHIYEVLKPRGKLVLIYHEESEKKLGRMVNAVEKAGFQLEETITTEMTQYRRVGFRSSNPKRNTVFIFTFKKK